MRRLLALLARIDPFDALLVAGYAMLLAGLWQLSPPLALIVGGTIALLGGIAGTVYVLHR